MWRKKKKEKVQKEGTVKKKGRFTAQKFRRFVMRLCWCLLAASFGFAVYKNFTAVDVVTVLEKETVVEKVENYAGIESFVQNFAKVYFTYSTDNTKQTKKKEQLAEYMQKSLAEANQGDSYAKGEITVREVQVWSVEPLTEENQDFKVLFTVTAETEGTDEGETGKEKQEEGQEEAQEEKVTEETAFTVNVHTESGKYVVTKNPTVASLPEKSGYKEAYLRSTDLAAGDKTAVESFLNTFFGIYPKASEKELAYYVKNSEVKPIEKDYELLSIDSLAIQKQDGESGYRVECYVSYMDHQLGVKVLNQYQLELAAQEDGQLIIMEMQ